MKKKQHKIREKKPKKSRLALWYESLSGKQKALGGGCIALLVLLVGILIWALIPHPVTFTYEDGLLYDKKHDIYYIEAPYIYQPSSYTKKEYGNTKDGSYSMHRIADLDPEKWLCEVYNGMAYLWYSADTELPTIEEMEPECIDLCYETTTVISKGKITSQLAVNRVMKLFDTEENVEVPTDDILDTFHLKFSSSLYPKLFYDMTYIETSDGNYLYDRQEKRCISVGTLFLNYLARDDMEADENSIGYTAPAATETGETTETAVETVTETGTESGSADANP